MTAAVTTDAKLDLREKIFYAMQGAKMPVLTMTVAKASLEDVFLKLATNEIPEDVQAKLKGGIAAKTVSETLEETEGGDDE